MWLTFFLVSIGLVLLFCLAAFVIDKGLSGRKGVLNPLNTILAGVLLSAILMFYPIHWQGMEGGLAGGLGALLLSLFNSMQIFALGCEFAVVTDGLAACPVWLTEAYRMWAACLFVLAPILTFSFVLSLFHNLSAYMKYLRSYFKDAYIFSELNERSLTLAADIKTHHPQAVLVFTDVFEGNEEGSFELIEEAKHLRAICFKRDVLAVNFKGHSKKKAISFFTMGADETENLNQSLKLIERYRTRKGVHLYVFTTNVASEPLLSSADKGTVKVRRIHEARSLINRVLYDRGEILFKSAVQDDRGVRRIAAVVVGMGCHGTEMVKALAWYGQMDGYELEIHGFDQDPLAEERFVAQASELMSKEYNGVFVDGEAQYWIRIHAGMNVETASFAREIASIRPTTYVLVALGNDELNLRTAITLRMYYERMGIHPIIQAILYNTQQKNALQGVHNFKGEAYDIEFIGDVGSSYAEDVIINSALEQEALKRHLKWGAEEDFWNYEYNYRSSVASAIHLRARVLCGIPGADKREEELTPEEREIIEALEHRRWNAYMRAEGYVYSGSKDKSSRNDLGKMHHDLVDYASLPDDIKRYDSRIGTE